MKGIRKECIRCGFCCMEFPNCGLTGNRVESGRCIHLIVDEDKTTCRLMIGKIESDECIVKGLPWFDRDKDEKQLNLYLKNLHREWIEKGCLPKINIDKKYGGSNIHFNE